jgi:hypothetical protein
MVGSTDDALVVDMNYACAGHGWFRPATPPDASIVIAFKLVLAAVVVLPLIIGLVMTLLLLAGAAPESLLRRLPTPS